MEEKMDNPMPSFICAIAVSYIVLTSGICQASDQSSQHPDAPAQRDGQKERCFVYAASPYGFAKSTQDFRRQRFDKAIEDAGCTVLDPWDLPPSPDPGASNAAAIEKSHGLVAALDGADVDSGTAAEIGYAAGLRRWIIGYRGDTRQTGEGLGTTVNLQVEYFVYKSGGQVVCSLPALQEAVACKTGTCKRDLTLKSCDAQRKLDEK